MRKLLLSAMLTMVGILMLATIASAAPQPYYHGDFATDTTGCAKCHVTHAGSAAALLVDGPSQTTFCYFCHNGITKSPYDAQNGKIATGTGVMPSVAGGFERTFNFDDAGLTYNEHAATGGGLDANFIANTSKHGVETYESDEWVNGITIPGGTGAGANLVGKFRCGSCHDPHAGGAYTGANIMPRLLKKALPSATFTAATFGDSTTPATYDGRWTFSAVADANATGFKTTVVEKYGDGISAWCAGCHNLFNYTTHNPGTGQVANAGKYMHRIDFKLSAAGKVSLGGNNVIQKLPLSTNDKLNCLTCHRAHGTASAVTAGTVFNRYAAYEQGTGAAAAATNESTVLLRQKNRDVCYNCHLAATENTPAIQLN